MSNGSDSDSSGELMETKNGVGQDSEDSDGDESEGSEHENGAGSENVSDVEDTDSDEGDNPVNIDDGSDEEQIENNGGKTVESDSSDDANEQDDSDEDKSEYDKSDEDKSDEDKSDEDNSEEDKSDEDDDPADDEDEDVSSMSEAEAFSKDNANTSGSLLSKEENQNSENPRKRGRPPKESVSAAEVSPGKRGRGRPKKSENSSSRQLDETGSDEADFSSPNYKKLKTEEDENRRRSGRERKVPKKFEVAIEENKSKKKKRRAVIASDSSDNDDSDSEYDVKKKKVKKKSDKSNNGNKKSPTKLKRKKTPKTKVTNTDAEDASDEEGAHVAKQYRQLQKKIMNGKSQVYQDKKSNRLTERKKYAEEEESHSSDVRSDYDPNEQEVVVEEEMEGIDFVLDHREGKVGATGERTMFWSVQNEGDPNLTMETEETEEQYLIKWSGWSHLNNTWESKDSLDAKKKGDKEVKGMRKLVNYQLKLADYKAWKRRANPEDVEYHEIDIEMQRQLLLTYIQVERIFAQRKNDTGGLDYYVKWKNLPYSEASWEDESVITSYYSNDLDQYLARKKAKCNPRSYSASMKACKKKFVALKEQPSYLGSEELKLRSYQMDGVNFMLNAWTRGCSTILADEMGLGKTIQSISFLKYLFHNYPFKGPMLVVVPLSTMPAWQKEFGQWGVDMNMVAYIGDGKSREIIRQFECENSDGELIFNVLLTNYEMVCKDSTFFQDIVWSNIVVDEAHRLKSDTSLLYKVLLSIESHHRLLLTGTPLQNSLKELWCLLKYLQLPDIDIESWTQFEADYGTAEDRATGYVKLHSLLKPYIIRRMKKDVEKSLPPKMEQILRIEMTVRQKNLYKLVLTKNYDALSKGKNQVSLLNIMMQLRKTCNHVELINEIPEEEVTSTTEARLHQLIYGSGKLVLLDKLLTRFREKGDRVLIFSQMVIMLNLLEEFCTLKRYPFQRLDGGVNNDKRKQAIAQFNDPNSPDFCFLLSTKAGGLGINLQTANRVIIFDSDWNPQNDLQAIARAHRIGQKEEVKIFRFVASSSVDEDIIHRAKNKMVLDHLVIQSMDTTGKTVIGGAPESKKTNTPFNKSELNMILKFGAEDLFKNDETEEERDKEMDLDAILESAETREDEEAPQSEANRELLGAFKCTNIAYDEEEAVDEKEDKTPRDWSDIIPSAMVEKHREKTGIDAYSDPEELFNPIAMRRKKRQKKKFERFAAEESAPNSAAASREGSDEDEDKDDDDEASDDSDMTDGEKEMRKKLKQSNAYTDKVKSGTKGTKGTYAKKSVICLKCKKCFVDKKGLKKHMRDLHGDNDWIFTGANILDAFPVNTDSPADSGGEALLAGGGGVNGGDSHKKKRGPPQGNTRCFACNKSFQNRIGYKTHIKKHHEGVEPPENTDPANLALPDDRISCLICLKKFTSVLGLKGHIQRVHLGIAPAEVSKEEDDEEEGKDGENDAEIREDTTVNEEDGGQEEDKESTENTNDVKEETKSEAKPVSQEDARLIEKMYYMMRRYGCQYCPARFNNKGKLMMHESIHAKDKKPVVCPHCEKSYSRRDKLRKHIDRIHPGKPMPVSTGASPPEKPKRDEIERKSGDGSIETGKTKWPFPAAEKGTIRPGPVRISSSSIRQITTADGVIKFQCPECDTMFSYQKGCVRHMKMFHGGERTYQCKLCPLAYSDNKGLYQHMHRKHPKKPQNQAVASTITPDHSEDSEDSQTSVPSQAGSDTLGHQCKHCPRIYANAGSLWAHKKAKHPETLIIPNSPLVEASILPHAPLVTTPTLTPNQSLISTPTPSSVPPKKEFNCKICAKTYSNYMSLYMHKKTKHPNTGPPGSVVSSPQNGSIQVLSLGASPITPTGRREKIHQCAQCPKRYADLKGLAAHIEKIHSNQLVRNILPTPPPVHTTEKVPLECPYCPNSYSRRDKLNEHIRKIHPDKEVPRASRSPNKIMTPPNPLALLAETLKLPLTHASAPRQAEAPTISHRVGDANIQAVLKKMAIPPIQPIPTPSRVPLLLPVNGVVRGKYKPKQFACPHCGKRYSDATRLQTHVEARHLQSNDPWKDVGPGADIAVKNEHYPSGFEVFKVIGVYSTGLRLKCVRFAPIDLNKWVLTEEINKNVVKQNILKILTPNIFYKMEGSQVFTMDRATVAGLYRGLGHGQNGSSKNGESSDDERLEIDQSRESEMNGKDESNGFNEDDDKVMVEPVFEDGLSESGDIIEEAPSEPGDIDEVQVSEEATMSDDDASEDPMSESRDPLE